MPLPPSDGFAPRIAGIFVYGSDIPVTPWVAGCRAERVGAVLPPFLQNFPAIWDERRNEIVKGLRYLETYDLSGNRRRRFGTSWWMRARSTCAPGKFIST
jgi:hypothetical protein